MLPLMDQRSISLYEKYTEHTQLAVGDWIVFDRGDQPNVLHRVLEVTPKDFFVSGVNTPRSDGWFPRSRIKLRVAGILYTSH